MRWGLEPAKPIARTTTVRRDHKNLNVRVQLAVENVVREARHSIAPNTRRKFNAISVRVFANLDHGRFKGSKIACAKARPLLLVVGDVLKVFNPRRLTEKVAHLSKDCA